MIKTNYLHFTIVLIHRTHIVCEWHVCVMQNLNCQLTMNAEWMKSTGEKVSVLKWVKLSGYQFQRKATNTPKISKTVEEIENSS